MSYWSPAEQIAHVTLSNWSIAAHRRRVRIGTLPAPIPAEGGSFIELTARGAHPLDLPNGETRRFLQDGDRIVMRGGADPVRHAWVSASSTARSSRQTVIMGRLALR